MEFHFQMFPTQVFHQPKILVHNTGGNFCSCSQFLSWSSYLSAKGKERRCPELKKHQNSNDLLKDLVVIRSKGEKWAKCRCLFSLF